MAVHREPEPVYSSPWWAEAPAVEAGAATRKLSMTGDVSADGIEVWSRARSESSAWEELAMSACEVGGEGSCCR